MHLPIVFGAPSGVRAGAVADLLARDHEVLCLADVSDALCECRRCSPAAAVLPFTPAREGEILRLLRDRGRQTAVFLYGEAGPLPPEAGYRALAAGARGLLDVRAPDFPGDLVRRLTRLLADLRLRCEEEEARAQLFARHDVVGASAAMQDVFRRAIKANRFDDLPVLIEGEHGTPKRRLASAILALDPSRVRMPLFALHCDGLDGLLETLAALSVQNNRTVAGQWDELLRTAQGGAVYLEEIGSLDRELQQALLAFVRRRPGAVRVIAATERPVQELVSAGRLDARLAAWLGLFRIPLPSLRGRPDDIAAQARHVLQSAAAGSAGPVTEFGPGVLAVLERLPWEGNTRQLEEVLRQALAMKRDGGPLRLDDLPAWARKVSLDAELPEPVPHPGDWMDEVQGETGGPLDSAADQYERGLLRTLVGRHASADMDAVRPDHQVQGR